MKGYLKRISDMIYRNSLPFMLGRAQHIAVLRASERYADPRSLTRHEHQVFSQNGEDGAIREIFRRIGEESRFFVEIGVGDGLENNTTFLLLQGWHGIWIEGSSKQCKAIRRKFQDELSAGQLILIEALVTAENVNELLAPHVPADIDLLSLDIDRNTYHVWKAMNAVNARVTVVEYNPTFPADLAWTVNYDPSLWWKGTSYYGASLRSLAELGASRADQLVGCDLTGTNAYFVQSALCGDKFLAPGSAIHHYEPCRTFLQGRKAGFPRDFSDRH